MKIKPITINEVFIPKDGILLHVKANLIIKNAKSKLIKAKKTSKNVSRTRRLLKKAKAKL